MIVVLLLFVHGGLLRADGPTSATRVDQHTTVTLTPGRISLEHAVTLNPAAAYLELLKMDVDADGDPTPDEQKRYFAETADVVSRGLELLVDGVEHELRPVGQVELRMPFTKIYRFEVDQPIGWADGIELELHNDAYLEMSGNITMAIKPGDQADIVYNSLAHQFEPDPLLLSAGFAFMSQRDMTLRYQVGSGKH